VVDRSPLESQFEAQR
jgi:hypothetical protein